MKLTSKDIINLLNKVLACDIIDDAIYIRPQECLYLKGLEQDIRLVLSKLEELPFSIENI